MPLCSRRAWKTPAGFPTWPTPGCYDDGVVLPRFNPDPQTGRRRVFIMTTIQTQRPTLVYVACFYPDLTAFAGLLLSRHSQLLGLDDEYRLFYSQLSAQGHADPEDL